MNADQREFDLGELDSAALAAHSGDDLGPLSDNWPQLLAELVDVLVALYRRKGMNDDKAVIEAQDAVLAIAHYLGGRQFYLPKGEPLRAALIARTIYVLNRGNNKLQLAERFGVSERRIEQIIAEQSRIQVRRRQGQLFSTGYKGE